MERPGKIGQKAILLHMHKEKFSQGFRDGFPIALGYLAVGFGIGISCRSARLNVLQGLLLSLLNNASAGEYGGITVMTEDAGYLTMVLMMLVVNARYMLMSCALSQRLAPGTGLKQRLLIGFDLTDELFGLAVAQPGYLDPYYYYGAMAVVMPAWSGGTVLGVLLGQTLPAWALSGLSVLLFGMFIAIIVPESKKNPVVLGCVIVSFICSFLATRLPLLQRMSEGMRTLLLTVVLSAAAALLFPRKEDTVQ